MIWGDNGHERGPCCFLQLAQLKLLHLGRFLVLLFTPAGTDAWSQPLWQSVRLGLCVCVCQQQPTQPLCPVCVCGHSLHQYGVGVGS